MLIEVDLHDGAVGGDCEHAEHDSKYYHMSSRDNVMYTYVFTFDNQCGQTADMGYILSTINTMWDACIISVFQTCVTLYEQYCDLHRLKNAPGLLELRHVRADIFLEGQGMRTVHDDELVHQVRVESSYSPSHSPTPVMTNKHTRLVAYTEHNAEHLPCTEFHTNNDQQAHTIGSLRNKVQTFPLLHASLV